MYLNKESHEINCIQAISGIGKSSFLGYFMMRRIIEHEKDISVGDKRNIPSFRVTFQHELDVVCTYDGNIGKVYDCKEGYKNLNDYHLLDSTSDLHYINKIGKKMILLVISSELNTIPLDKIEVHLWLEPCIYCL